jgi:UDP-N-acetylmuramoyl-tripeptide--D-alanyl-D-alanine ligase
MRELGPDSAALHLDIARRAVGGPFDVIAGIGDFDAALRAVAEGDARIVSGADVDDLWPRLEPRLVPDAMILIKASRGMRLERLVPHLTAWAGAPS